MVTIRLALGGARNRRFYQIVVAEKHFPRDGRHIEKIGYYNPTAKGAEVGLNINKDRIKYWISKGAQLSDKVKYLLKKFEKMSAATSKEEDIV